MKVEGSREAGSIAQSCGCRGIRSCDWAVHESYPAQPQTLRNVSVRYGGQRSSVSRLDFEPRNISGDFGPNWDFFERDRYYQPRCGEWRKRLGTINHFPKSPGCIVISGLSTTHVTSLWNKAVWSLQTHLLQCLSSQIQIFTFLFATGDRIWSTDCTITRSDPVPLTLHTVIHLQFRAILPASRDPSTFILSCKSVMQHYIWE